MKAFRNTGKAFIIMAFVLMTIFFLSTGFESNVKKRANPKTHMVSISKMKFEPESLEVHKGDIVEWVNKDFVTHDVTEISKKWNSKPLKQGDKFSKVITKDLDYFCSIHVVMKGSVKINK